MPQYIIEITDLDALDAINAEIERIAAAGGGTLSIDEYLSDFNTTQHRDMREPQLLAAARAKVEDDPKLIALRQRREEQAIDSGA